MSIILKIAFRNILINKKRSVLVGFAIFISSFLFLIVNSAMNGIEKQVLHGYQNIQSGHVVVLWEDMKNVSPMDSARFLTKTKSFDIDDDDKNRTAMKELFDYLDKHEDEVEHFFPTIKLNGKVIAGEGEDKSTDSSFIVYGLSEENKDFILDTDTLKMKEGKMLSNKKNGVCISVEKAENMDLKLGDQIEVEVSTATKEVGSDTFEITGIHENGAAYDNAYVFMSIPDVRELSKYENDYFDVGRIYLKDSKESQNFAEALDDYLSSGKKMLRAESYADASPFYTNTSQSIRIFLNIFNIFLFFMIAVGLRTTVKMNLFERMKEFGTIRAIGYSRVQSFFIIFFEVFFLALAALVIAAVLSLIIVTAIGNAGVFVGNNGLSYLIGGETLYPIFKLSDVIMATIVIVAFSLIATIKGGLTICYQPITDSLMKKQVKVRILKSIFKVV